MGVIFKSVNNSFSLKNVLLENKESNSLYVTFIIVLSFNSFFLKSLPIRETNLTKSILLLGWIPYLLPQYQGDSLPLPIPQYRD